MKSDPANKQKSNYTYASQISLNESESLNLQAFTNAITNE